MIEFLRGRATSAFGIVDQHLREREFLLGKRPTIADFSLVGYLYYREETGVDLGRIPEPGRLDRAHRRPAGLEAPLRPHAARPESLNPRDGIVRVGRQTQGRKGKGVTVITGVPLAGVELDALATQLKRRCGSGGTVKDGVIEIQGDHREFLLGELQQRGWTVKRSGG